MKLALLLFLFLVLQPPPTEPSAARSLTVAWPRIIMFYGGVLDGRRYVTDSVQIVRFMGAISKSATDAQPVVAGRSYVEVSLYWHSPSWEPYAADTALLSRLRPELGQPARAVSG